MDGPPLWGMCANQILWSPCPRGVSGDPAARLDRHANAPLALARGQHSRPPLLLEHFARRPAVKFSTCQRHATADNEILLEVTAQPPPGTSGTSAPSDWIMWLSRLPFGDVAAVVVIFVSLVVEAVLNRLFAWRLEDLGLTVLGVYGLQPISRWRLCQLLANDFSAHEQRKQAIHILLRHPCCRVEAGRHRMDLELSPGHA
mmetsp:Transcript_112019/g.157042  ORF Transcript_112019/g.157042 Transcript_112019/m.157042 type:complete len:201 (+) Transcript_112019:402-1004(+)